MELILYYSPHMSTGVHVDACSLNNVLFYYKLFSINMHVLIRVRVLRKSLFMVILITLPIAVREHSDLRKSLFWLTVQGYSSSSWGSPSSKSFKLVTLYPQPRSRVTNVCVQLISPFLVQPRISAQGIVPPLLGRIFPPLLTQSK